MLSPAALWREGHTEWRLTGRVVNYADEMFRPGDAFPHILSSACHFFILTVFLHRALIGPLTQTLQHSCRPFG